MVFFNVIQLLLASLPLFVPAISSGFPDCENGPLKSNAVCDTTKPVAERASALVNAMTVEEKLNNTGNENPEIPRLGIPSYNWWSEALHGVASRHGVNFSDEGDFSYATSFPQPILMAAAFDDQLIQDVATVISTEARAFNNFGRAGLDFWTPNINPFKDPRWGRGQETPGEDPFHVSSYVKSLINGLQGGQDPPIRRIVATCKHLVAYDMETWGGHLRYQFDAQVSMQDLKEYYLPPFQACARDAAVGAIMCSYNALNGVPTCADDYLLQTILRDHWNWTAPEYWVVSDCDAVQNVFDSGGHGHAYLQSRAKAAGYSLLAGTDLNCGTYYQSHLPGALDKGIITEAALDKALIRLFASLVKVGYFDGPSAQYRDLGWSDVATDSSGALALKAATESIVLLKNDGTLPISIEPGMSIAVIGDWANATEQMQGNYFGVPPYLHSPLYAAEQLGATVYYAEGPSQGNPTTNDWLHPLDAAKRADIVFYFGGLDDGTESEGNDRYWIDWTAAQRDLIAQVAGMGKPCVLTQFGTMLDSSQMAANPNINAILWAGYPGQDGGTAVFDIVTGKTAPAGRLPITQYPADFVDIPMTEMALRPGPNNDYPGRTYRWYTGKPIFEYGFGLHYTSFTTTFPESSSSSLPDSTYEISSLMSTCTDPFPDRCPFARFPIDVRNTGAVASDFSTLGFIAGQFGPQPYPIKTLVAYDRVHDVQPGDSATATLNLTLGSLARIDEVGDTVLYPGEYSIWLDVPTQTTFNFSVTGDPVILDKFPQRPE